MKTQLALLLTLFGATVAAGGCLDLNLLDDLREIDAGAPAETDSENPGDENRPPADGEENGAAEPSGQTAAGETAEAPTPPAPDTTDKDPPELAEPDCGPYEQTVDQLCVAVGPGSASLRFVTDEQAEVSGAAGEAEAAAVLSNAWEQQHHLLFSGLVPETATSLVLSVKDVNGNARDFEISVTATGGPKVAITEILADPIGPEPDQEFVEIANLGSAAIDISGWMIDDNGDTNGDIIRDGTVLGAGQIAIVVGPSYGAAPNGDPVPAQDTLIIALDTSIGSSGLKNSEAETVELYDAAGGLVSRYLGQGGIPKEGCSFIRRRADLPDGDADAFVSEPNGTSTPGLIPVPE